MEEHVVGILEGTEIQQTPRVADIFAQISCYVCQAPSSGIHFGRNDFDFDEIFLHRFSQVRLLVKVVK